MESDSPGEVWGLCEYLCDIGGAFGMGKIGGSSSPTK